MTANNAKNKIEIFLGRYNENIGSFESFLVIFDFFEFLKNESKIKTILKKQFEYCEQQLNIIEEMSDKDINQFLPNKKIFDIKEPETWETVIFKKEQEQIVKMAKKSEPLNLVDLELPAALLNLSLVYGLVKQAKEDSKTNPQNAIELIQKIKELSGMYIPIKIKDDDKEKSISIIMSKYYLRCIAVIGQYILNELSAEEFLKGNKPKSLISFNEKESLLTINGTIIKISRTTERSIDHYILDTIFKNKDISEEVYFKDVAKRIDEFADYDKTKDWRKFYRACEHLNQKIQTDTHNTIIDFIEPHTGNKAWCKINLKYLKS